ncbi:tyrosine-type recombinase/integrase [Candidatus Dojkabacteria bacterium]|nr:tyrosine-type recombinase/integrase [Candidatus Dojkabacteria bacterium]
MTLPEALKQFTEYLEKQGRSLSTITAYSKDIEQMKDYLSQEESVKKIEEVNTKQLNNYINKIRSDKKSNYTLKTISRKINSMKTLFKFLISEQYVDNNPALSVKHPKYEISPPRILTKLEYCALRDVTRTNLRLFTIVELLLQTGVRIGELARLTIEDVALDSNTPKINVKAFGSNPAREVELNSQAELALRKYLEIRPQAEDKVNALFVTKNGNPLLVRNIRTSITRSLKKIGVKGATVNDIRNTFILHQLKNGMPIDVLAITVGHKRITSTKRYLELIDDKPKRKSTKILPL